MSYFNDIVVAQEADADAVARTSLPARKWPGLELKNINIIDLDNLYEAVVPPPQRHDLGSISRYLPEIPVTKKRVAIHRFPTDLATALANATPEDLTSHAESWFHAEEFRGSWPAEELRIVLKELQALAQRARSEGAALLYCMAG